MFINSEENIKNGFIDCFTSQYNEVSRLNRLVDR